MSLRARVVLLVAFAMLLTVGCVGPDDTSGANPDAVDPSHPITPGMTVDPELSETEKGELAAIELELASTATTHAELVQRYPLSFAPGLSYDPQTAAGLDVIQASGHALDADELAGLSSHGFVITERQSFPSFVYGYESIYAQDLPLYISADSILHALHRSYDDMLQAAEIHALIPELEQLLTAMRTSLQSGAIDALGEDAVRDADLYLAVAQSLLTGTSAGPVATAHTEDIEVLVSKAVAANGMETLELFGASRRLDFSQFTPRGHYTDTEALSRYFQAMMWLGRIDLRMLETQDDGSRVFHRRQFDAALGLNGLMDDASVARWERINAVIEAFVGVSDNMTPPEFGQLMTDLGAASLEEAAALSDNAMAAAVVRGGYGRQQIASHIMINGVGQGTLPLNIAFLVFGQRYVLDSHVFSNVVYDRVQAGTVKRMMPNPLDVAFAALGNNQAAQLLEEEMRTYPYASDLDAMRLLADRHDSDFWGANLYHLWLSALRALSADPTAAGLPEVARTEAWGRRLLNAQMASWAELRHDTILYAKQSYTAGASCEFPDAYVDPYPEVYARIGEWAREGRAAIGGLTFTSEWMGGQFDAYFTGLEAVAGTLQEMAEHQREGKPLTEEHLAFVNNAVAIQMGCGDPMGLDGWYRDLFFDQAGAVDFDPTIADVHTQPTDAAGSVVGHVLHVGTGMPRLMVVTIDTCTGPRAYAGLASSYFETVTGDFERLDDEGWSEALLQETPDDVWWMQDIVVR